MSSDRLLSVITLSLDIWAMVGCWKVKTMTETSKIFLTVAMLIIIANAFVYNWGYLVSSDIALFIKGWGAALILYGSVYIGEQWTKPSTNN